MGTQLDRQIHKYVISVPRALAALDRMERQLSSVKTYEALRRIQREAEALKILLGHVREVKERSQLVLALARQRIAQELKKVDPAPRGVSKFRPPSKLRKTVGKSKPGKAATGVSKDSRSRLAKLLNITKEDLRAIVKQLHLDGKDATEGAILSVLKEREIKKTRKTFEDRRDKGARVEDLLAMAERGETFGVIAPDPAWEFKVYSGKGKQRSAERHYDTSSLEAIKAFGKKYVTPLMAKDCALLTWCVWPELQGALDVIKAWGTEYKTVGFVWIKTSKGAKLITVDGKGLHWGMGYHTRANSEVMLLATRGNVQRIAKDVHQVVVAPVGAHSAKPDEIYRRIERLYNGPYLELFARKPRKGWTCWGHEISAPPALKEAAE